MTDIIKLAAQIYLAEIAGREAADACADDGGTANLDHVVICRPSTATGA
ncbi:hypothetical protein Q4543_17680 [Salipiger sp. 1_MG-2023]|nr:hypothetical protein [Salipiger sp. 1_MG-2023]MDO6587346.1 hypothetical protein [Salipiger sp. 1_MG-2023]